MAEVLELDFDGGKPVVCQAEETQKPKARKRVIVRKKRGVKNTDSKRGNSKRGIKCTNIVQEAETEPKSEIPWLSPTQTEVPQVVEDPKSAGLEWDVSEDGLVYKLGWFYFNEDGHRIVPANAQYFTKQNVVDCPTCNVVAWENVYGFAPAICKRCGRQLQFRTVQDCNAYKDNEWRPKHPPPKFHSA